MHTNNSRKHGNDIAVNCGAIPDGTVDSGRLRTRKRSVHGRDGKPQGLFRGSGRRHDLPRRSGRAAAHDPSPAVARTANRRVHPRRVVESAEDQRPGRRGDQHQSAQCHSRRALQGGPLLSAQYGPHTHFLLCGSAKETSICFSESSPSISQRSTACRPFRWTSRQEKCSKATVGPAISASSKT